MPIFGVRILGEGGGTENPILGFYLKMKKKFYLAKMKICIVNSGKSIHLTNLKFYHVIKHKIYLVDWYSNLDWRMNNNAKFFIFQKLTGIKIGATLSSIQGPRCVPCSRYHIRVGVPSTVEEWGPFLENVEKRQNSRNLLKYQFFYIFRDLSTENEEFHHGSDMKWLNTP